MLTERESVEGPASLDHTHPRSPGVGSRVCCRDVKGHLLRRG
ncbi:hypothetical protein Rhow_005873 [Rhodococcus wratislaviensis]|uniref:Uncharacterized protein n=1 Tax=Rhodococcus wratislaviensis TaxID=44752 RepID=A0A402BZV1_RHOWR|nr:hypothetical protein Rhow_005873 [Rhodococcus wratislaviensis]